MSSTITPFFMTYKFVKSSKINKSINELPDSHNTAIPSSQLVTTLPNHSRMKKETQKSFQSSLGVTKKKKRTIKIITTSRKFNVNNSSNYRRF